MQLLRFVIKLTVFSCLTMRLDGGNIEQWCRDNQGEEFGKVLAASDLFSEGVLIKTPKRNLIVRRLKPPEIPLPYADSKVYEVLKKALVSHNTNYKWIRFVVIFNKVLYYNSNDDTIHLSKVEIDQRVGFFEPMASQQDIEQWLLTLISSQVVVIVFEFPK